MLNNIYRSNYTKITSVWLIFERVGPILTEIQPAELPLILEIQYISVTLITLRGRRGTASLQKHSSQSIHSSAFFRTALDREAVCSISDTKPPGQGLENNQI